MIILTIGQRIKNRRIQLGLTQSERAHKLGYESKATIARIEADSRNLKQSKIKAIADALDTTPSYIMGWEEESNSEKTALSDSQKELLEKISRLDDSKVSTLLELCDLYLSAQDKME